MRGILFYSVFILLLLCLYIGMKELLLAPGKLPGCSGTRNLHDNISDLRAQVAANQKASAQNCRIVRKVHVYVHCSTMCNICTIAANRQNLSYVCVHMSMVLCVQILSRFCIQRRKYNHSWSILEVLMC